MSNKVIIASAGSGKTTHLVREALAIHDRRVLITTFTDENTAEIKSKFHELNHCVPRNVTILPWFTFLLQDGVRPYQGVMFEKRISYIHLVSGSSAQYIPESNHLKHYLSDEETVYSDKLAKLTCKINELTNGAVISRIEKIYDYIFIDEIQDLAGYDLSIIDLLFRSKVNTLLVGDPRQATFVTNNSQKNKQFKYASIETFFASMQRKRMIDYDTTTLNVNHRCVQSICDFANELYPEYSSVQSDNNIENNHTGVLYVKPEDFSHYMQRYHPMILRHDIRTMIPESYPALNFGKSKGRTFDRVLIFPTRPVLDWIQKGKELTGTSKSKFYVALTRARFSVAIVCDKDTNNRRRIPFYDREQLI